MPLHMLSLENLSILEGGKVTVAFDRLLQRAVDDCLDRPGEGKARVVTLQVEVIPIPDQDGSCAKTDVQVQLQSKVPNYRTQAISCGLRRRRIDGGEHGMLVFNEDSPGEIDQGTFLP
jgi:hypothetical protein